MKCVLQAEIRTHWWSKRLNWNWYGHRICRVREGVCVCVWLCVFLGVWEHRHQHHCSCALKCAMEYTVCAICLCILPLITMILFGPPFENTKYAFICIWACEWCLRAWAQPLVSVMYECDNTLCINEITSHHHHRHHRHRHRHHNHHRWGEKEWVGSDGSRMSHRADTSEFIAVASFSSPFIMFCKSTEWAKNRNYHKQWFVCKSPTTVLNVTSISKRFSLP